jgi:hypothetical protein
MMAACIGQPVSWLRLEQHALGAHDAAVAEHVAACAACRACLDAIAADDIALPAPPPIEVRARRAWWSWAIPAFGLAVAAAILLVVVRPRDAAAPREDVALVKGVGEVVLGVVRERAGAITEDARTFATGDRWKVVVTCPPGAQAWIDVGVVEDGAHTADHPLAPAQLACGNRVVVPGAFYLTGTRANRVCVTVSADAAAAHDMPRAGEPGVACVTITPE